MPSCTSTERFRAELYVALHTGTPNDVEFYREACAGTGRVLELGCGDGRVLLALGNVSSSIEGMPALVGIDSDPGMLALAAQRAQELGLRAESVDERTEHTDVVAFVRADMSDFEVPGRFDRIILPYSGLWCLRDDEKLSCLRAVRRHLTPGGKLLFDVYDADDMDEDAEVTAQDEPLRDDYEEVATVEVRGVRYHVFERNSYWFSRRTVEATFEYRATEHAEALPAEALTQVITHHYLERRALSALLGTAGFDRVILADGSVGEQGPETGQLYFACE